MPGIDDSKQFVPLKIAVLTVSDSRNLKDDKSGALLVQRIGAAGHFVAERSIVPDDIEAIRARVKAWIADPVIDVIITTGGTGFTGRDVTPEAVEPLFEKKMDAFSALFLVVSFQKIGTSAVQSRATAGVALHFLFAGLAWRLPRRLGRNPGASARLSLRAVQLRRDYAAARRAFAAREGQRGDDLAPTFLPRTKYGGGGPR
jgi:molybdenum cofactor biosynthesis protein B